MAQASHLASANGAARPFLTADWRHLVIVNYEVLRPEVAFVE